MTNSKQVPQVDLAVHCNYDSLKYDTVHTVWATCTVSVSAPQTMKRHTPHLVFVLDISKSMCQYKKWDSVVESMRYALKAIPSTAYITLITFNHKATTHFTVKRTWMNEKSVAALLTDLEPSGHTNLEIALCEHVPKAIKHCEIIESGGAVLHSVFVLSDGVVNVGITGSKLMKKMKTCYASFSDRCHLATFGFGQDHDARMLFKLAERYHGTYSYLPSIEDVQPAFELVLERMQQIVLPRIDLKLKAPRGTRIFNTGFSSDTAIVEHVFGKEYTVPLFMLGASTTRHIVLKLSVNMADAVTDSQLLLTATVPQAQATLTIERVNAPAKESAHVPDVWFHRLRLQTAETLHSAAKKPSHAITSFLNVYNTLRSKSVLFSDAPQLLKNRLNDLIADMKLCIDVVAKYAKDRRVRAYLYGLCLMYFYERPVHVAWLKANQKTLEKTPGFKNTNLVRSDTYGY